MKLKLVCNRLYIHTVRTAKLFLCITLLLFCNHPFAQPTDGLLGKFTFNNGKDANEVTGEKIKIVGASGTEDRFGNSNSAYYLHGNNGSYLNLGTSPKIKPTSGSISIWCKTELIVYSGTGYYVNPIILTKSHEGDDFFEGYSISLDYKTRKLCIAISYDSTKQICIRSAHGLRMEKWHHVVMAYDDHFLYLYINGRQEGKMMKNFHSRFLQTDSVMIGNSANKKNNRFYAGSVDDIQIYNRVLEPDEVLALYNAPNPNRYQVFVNWALIIVLSGLGMSGIVLLFTWKYKVQLLKEKEKSLLNHRVHEMEVQMLKAQMNPHFIFNAMNSVQQFILNGDNTNAYQYLVLFSRLLRKILESNKDAHVSLVDEIDILTKYIKIESLRFEQTFNFEIITDVELNPSKIRIPQMMVQPIVENAIWHGLLPSKAEKMLRIRFEYISKNMLSCTVDDNGVGRQMKKPDGSTPEKKSMAIKLIAQRLELMQKEWGGEYNIYITDKTDEAGNSKGTETVIQMPIINN